MSYPQFRQVLSLMVSLETLDLTGEVMEIPPMYTIKTISLPSLKALRIHPMENYNDCITILPDCVSALCAMIPTTTLWRLYIHVLIPKILSSFMNHLRSRTFCFPRVKSLWWSTSLSADNAVTIMQSFPALENLVLSDFECDSILKILMQHAPLLWPHLHIVSLECVTVQLL